MSFFIIQTAVSKLETSEVTSIIYHGVLTPLINQPVLDLIVQHFSQISQGN